MHVTHIFKIIREKPQRSLVSLVVVSEYLICSNNFSQFCYDSYMYIMMFIKYISIICIFNEKLLPPIHTFGLSHLCIYI